MPNEIFADQTGHGLKGQVESSEIEVSQRRVKARLVDDLKIQGRFEQVLPHRVSRSLQIPTFFSLFSCFKNDLTKASMTCKCTVPRKPLSKAATLREELFIIPSACDLY